MKYETEITIDMSAEQVGAAIGQTLLKYELAGAEARLERVKEGWLVAAIVSVNGKIQHWNYHPGRTSLTKTHETD